MRSCGSRIPRPRIRHRVTARYGLLWRAQNPSPELVNGHVRPETYADIGQRGTQRRSSLNTVLMIAVTIFTFCGTLRRGVPKRYLYKALRRFSRQERI